MSRISIDVTEEEHKRLKALAALQGVTLKEYLLKSALDARKEDEEEGPGRTRGVFAGPAYAGLRHRRRQQA